ncbi:hypothetical protein ACVIWV_006119 [Bradyrhizobium diazoefficiens]|uniref:Helix-turn-helix domain-containing protein n=1 Tax=Bradyrhizobium diazoefficiens TaxID=1355477 RepID=A0A0E4BSG0_9BRAD|nr:hypothetical protein [Bradyrhizobium diazoefficiens]MBR0867189.1 hypothetical protein [Bradyrhizobium diazoefficiens]MBR0891761.1 hypothetical protein [Bradyrhizobium diazoefficiens]MBR0923453.1 hypothetical protein [Bradyrhizobium diazoefficiens]BAR58844.1 hypothetical protein NK6_5687 [Bradyrhizobium diazoefficiens]
MLDRNRMIELHLQMLAELGWKPPSGDVIDEISNGGLLTVQRAAIICEVSDQTIYRWNDDATGKGQSLGKKGATWLIGTARLLDYVEKYQGGLPARVKAQNRLREYWPIWSKPQALRPI